MVLEAGGAWSSNVSVLQQADARADLWQCAVRGAFARASLKNAAQCIGRCRLHLIGSLNVGSDAQIDQDVLFGVGSHKGISQSMDMQCFSVTVSAHASSALPRRDRNPARRHPMMVME